MRYFVSTLAVFLLSIPVFTYAYELRVEPNVEINESYISDENLYLAGLQTNFKTTYEKDLVSLAFDQVIEGTVFGDVTLVGNDVALVGEVFGDVRIIANTIHISGVTNQDLVLVANKIIVDENAIINGDVLILANSVSLNGKYLGQNKITANSIAVMGTIIGPTTLTGQRVSFNSGSKVQSELSYFSPQRATIESEVEILSPLNFNQIESIKQNDVVKKVFFSFISFWAIIKLVATLFVILILTHLFKIFTQRVSDTLFKEKWMVLIVGFVTTICLPILILVLFGSLVFIPVSIILAFGFGILLILLPAVNAILIGQIYQVYVLKKKNPEVNFNISVLTLITLTFVAFIPYLGSTLIYLTYIGSFGAMIQYLYQQIRRKKIKL